MLNIMLIVFIDMHVTDYSTEMFSKVIVLLEYFDISIYDL